MKKLKRFVARGAVSALVLYIVILCVSAFWVNWPDAAEDTHGVVAIFALALVPITLMIGAGIGVFAALLVYLHEQSR